MCGVSHQAQVMLARHCVAGVTYTAYQDFRLLDLWGEIAKLPSVDPEGYQQEQLTGTDAAVAPMVALRTVPTRRQCPEMALDVQDETSNIGRGKRAGNPTKQANNRSKVGCDPGKSAIGATGFEPATSASRTHMTCIAD